MSTSRIPRSAAVAPAANRSLPMLLLRLRETVLLPLRQVFRDFDLTEQQARVLIMLHEAGPLAMLGLAETCCTHAPSLSRIIPRLRARGWIERHRREGDLRCVLVELTPQGHDVAARLIDALGRAHGGTLSRIGGGPAQALCLGLAAALAALGSPALTDGPEADEDGDA